MPGLSGRAHHGYRSGLLGAALIALTFTASPVLADAASALPPGPKDNLAQMVGTDVGQLKALLGKTLTEEQWRAELNGLEDESAAAALAGYLAINAPVGELSGADVETVIAALPADGKQLFLDTCLSCHGGDKYFLQQSLDQAGWMEVLGLPFHRRLLTEGTERETFASYAAATTPLALSSVPEELQDKPR